MSQKTVIKLTPPEKRLIKNVMAGVKGNKGEKWVRTQLSTYTKNLLNQLKNDKLRGKQKQAFERLRSSDQYDEWLKRSDEPQETETTQKDPVELVKELSAAADNQITRKKILFDISKQLDDLDSIGKFFTAGGYDVISNVFLNTTTNSEIKICANIFSQLAISVRCQIAIVSGPILNKIIELIDHKMMNVKTSALNCILKISSLFIGSKILVDNKIAEKCSILVSDTTTNIAVKTSAAQTLLNMSLFHHQLMETPPFTAIVAEFEKALDATYSLALLQILDVWNFPDIPQLPANEELVEHLEALKNDDPTTKVPSLNFLTSEMTHDVTNVFSFVQNSGVMCLLQLWISKSSNLEIVKGILSALEVIGSTSFGRRALFSAGILTRCLGSLSAATDPLHMFGLIRIIEIHSQDPDTAKPILKDGLNHVVNFINSHISLTFLNTLCFPAIRCLKNIVIALPDNKPQILEQIISLSDHIVPPTDREVSNPAHDDAIQEELIPCLEAVGAELNL